MSINTYPKKTLNELFGLEGQYVWPDDIDVIPEDAEVSNNNYGGYGGWNKGIPHTKETKRKIGLSEIGNQYRKGAKLSEETKEKMRQAALNRKVHPMLGKKHSEETRKKLSEKRKLYTGWNHSSETKEKMRQAAIRRWNK